MEHYDIKITGRVQGVSFRASAMVAAIELNVTGFAQNKTDGSVYIEAEGRKADMKQFVDWCKQGPKNARVAKVDISKGELKNFEIFEIKFL